jgi:hypothetical protein
VDEIMQAYEIKAAHSADLKLLSESISGLLKAVENCDTSDLKILNEMGYIPNGMLSFINATRVKL